MNPALCSQATAPGQPPSSHSSSSFNSQDEAEVAEVEMLLEAYDMHLEHALSRLQVREAAPTHSGLRGLMRSAGCR